MGTEVASIRKTLDATLLKLPSPECAVPAIAVSLIGTSIALAVLDLRRDWVDHATGAAFLLGMVMIGAGLPVFR